MIQATHTGRQRAMTIWHLMLLLAAIAMLIAAVGPTMHYFKFYHNRPLPQPTPATRSAPVPPTTTVPAPAPPTTLPPQ